MQNDRDASDSPDREFFFMSINDENIEDAVNMWINNNSLALETYGNIIYWLDTHYFRYLSYFDSNFYNRNTGFYYCENFIG